MASAQEKAQAILKKAIQAAGGEAALAQVQAVRSRLKGVLHEVEGATFTAEYWRQGYDRTRYTLRTEVNGVELSMLVVARGEDYWVKINDQLEPQQPLAREAAKRGMYVDRIATLLPLLTEKEFTLAALGDSDRDGQKLVGVRVVRKGQPDVQVFFDRDKGLLTRLEYRTLDEASGKEVAVVVLYSDHRVLNPIETETNTLKAANVSGTGPELLEYLRKRALSAASRERLAGLIRRLASESFAEREAAARDLVAAGPAAVPYLTEATRSTDVEVAQRAKDCLDKIKGDPASSVTTAVLRLVAFHRPKGAESVLLDFLPAAADPQLAREVRFTLAALAQRDGKPARALVEAAEGKDPLRRAAALAALGRDGGTLAREPGRRLFLPNVTVARKVLELREGKKYVEWERVEIELFHQLEETLFAKP